MEHWRLQWTGHAHTRTYAHTCTYTHPSLEIKKRDLGSHVKDWHKATHPAKETALMGMGRLLTRTRLGQESRLVHREDLRASVSGASASPVSCFRQLHVRVSHPIASPPFSTHQRGWLVAGGTGHARLSLLGSPWPQSGRVGAFISLLCHAQGPLPWQDGPKALESQGG